LSTTFTVDAQALPYPPAPPPGWISGQGDVLLQIAEAAIVGAGLGDRFIRRARVVDKPVFRSFGTAGPNGQLYVYLVGMYEGRSGEEQYRDSYGNRGQGAFRTAAWSIQFGLPWPTVKQAGVLPSPDDLGAVTHDLEDALGAVWAALYASAQNGYLDFAGNPIRPTANPTDGMLIGRSSPLPNRGFAGFEIPVTLQLA